MNGLGSFFGVSTKAINVVLWIIGIIILYFAIRNLYLKYVRRNSGKATVNPANLVIGRNYDNIAKQVHDEFDIFWTTNDTQSVCGQLMLLNDDEIGQVNNRYLILYGKGTKSLQDAIEGGFWGNPDESSPCGELLARLQAMQLN